MTRKKILLLTLVHPDFLPPVYAVAQVLRDLQFDIHILTFDSFVPAHLDIGSNITVESMGKHFTANAMKRMKYRGKFTERAKELVKEDPVAVITFCPFSFQCGIKVHKNKPLIYIALEIADFVLPQVLRSPLSNIRNLRTLRNIIKADLIATPSIQRSAWLAGRCHLDFMPHTILNTAYIPVQEEENTYETFKGLVPASFLDKKIVLYTGAVNADLCTMELVRAFDLVNDPGSALIITGIKDNEYCQDVEKYVANAKTQDRIKLFPYLTRAQMLSLQANAHIGACLVKEYEHNVKSKMMAPNKTGEYLSKNLYILGIMTEYLRPFQTKGFAALSDSATPRDISRAIRDALIAVTDEQYKARIRRFVLEEFSMQQQLKPVISYLNEVISLRT